MSQIEIKEVTAVQPSNRMNLLQRVKGIIFSPGAAMENLIERPRLIFPLIITAVSMLALYLLRFQLYTDYLRQNTMNSQALTQSLTGITLTPEQIEQSVEIGKNTVFYAIPLSMLFAWFLSTVIFFAIFKIFGAKGRFKQYFSIIGYSYVITVLYLILTAIASFFTNSLHIDLPLTSLANLLPADMSGSFIYGIAKGLDIFSIWYYCVIAIGLAALSGFKKRNAYILVAAIFVIGLIITGSTELARGAMMGG